jgi:hypothetical protein
MLISEVNDRGTALCRAAPERCEIARNAFRALDVIEQLLVVK